MSNNNYKDFWAEIKPVGNLFVFIDTSEFHRAHFNFNSRNLRHLCDWSSERKSTILITKVLEIEVDRAIEQKVKAFVSAAKKFRAEAHVVNGLESWGNGDLFCRPDAQKITAEAVKRFWSSISEMNIKKVDIGDKALDDALHLYKNMSPPFGPGKKQKEFPDALNILALRKFSRENFSVIHIASGDQDIEKACEDDPCFVFHKGIAALIEYAISADDELAWIEDSFSDQYDFLHEWMADAFLASPIYAADEDVEILEYEIQGVEWNRIRVLEKQISKTEIKYTLSVVGYVDGLAYISVSRFDEQLAYEGSYPYENDEFHEHYRHHVDFTVLSTVNRVSGDLSIEEISIDDTHDFAIRFGAKF